ncbi:MAG: DUF3352 domain-containing protein [Candidatus Sericytochromatia bacterium]|nr:DUF3352 domain-containing protein [Candidatus Sericytochromatia bacterium]
MSRFNKLNKIRFALPRKSTLSALATLAIITGLSLPAQAAVENVLNPLPQDAISATVIDLQPSAWTFVLNQPGLKDWLMMDEWKEMQEGLKKELDIGVEEVLGSLGTHLAFGLYKPKDAESDLDLVFALELKSADLYQKMVQKLKEKTEKKTNADLPKSKIETYNNQELILIESDSDPNKIESAMTFQGNTLLLSNQVALLKQSLDALSQGKNLSKNPDFAAVYQNMKQEPVVVWMDLKVLKETSHNSELKSFQNDLASIGLTQTTLAMNQSLGISMRLNEQGLAFKNSLSFSSKGLSGSQQGYLNKLTSPLPSLDPLLALMPARPLFSAMTNTLTLAIENPILSGDKTSDSEKNELAQAMVEMMAGTKEISGLDLKKDILAHSDGRIGISVFYPENFPTYKNMPSSVVMLGVKNGPEFLLNLQTKLKIVANPLEKAAEAKTEKPITLSKEPMETYLNVPIYTLSEDRFLKPLAEETQMELAPCFAIYQDFFLVASNHMAMRATLDYAKSNRLALKADPTFLQARQRMSAQSELNLFYSDLTRWVRLADHFLHAEDWYPTFKPLLASLQSLAGDGSVNKQGSSGHLHLNAAFDKVDFAKLVKELEALDSETQKPE